MPLQNAEIAAMFDQAADLLEIKGDNPFRTRAYHRAARVIERLPKSIANLKLSPGRGRSFGIAGHRQRLGRQGRRYRQFRKI